MVTVFSILPLTVTFSYADETCVDRLTVLPDLQKVKSDQMEVRHESVQSIGSFKAFSRKTCITSPTLPKAADHFIRESLLGSIIIGRSMVVRVPQPPKLNVSVLKREVSSAKPLLLPLESTDRTFSYYLASSGASVKCSPANKALSCDMKKLGVPQGTSAPYVISRSYKQSPLKTLATGTLTTLKAVSVTKSSIVKDQTVYAPVVSLTLDTDKPLKRADVTLTKGATPVDGTTTKFENNQVLVTAPAQLERESTYTLTLDNAEAADGSGLDAPYVLPFKTSGGPKVTSVSVGATKVGQSATVLLTFDQPLSKTKDIMPFITFAGGSATVQKRSDTQVAVQLNALPRCQAFTVTVKKNIPSEHDFGSSQDWTFSARTICQQVSSYGSSIKGRSLDAYLFGSSGPVTMYVGGIHGNEASSTSLMRAWINELEANPARYAGKRVVVVPAINPDGLAANTRTNARGVNLNRNFPTDNWVKSINDTDGAHESGGGEAPLSEPEAAALAQLTKVYNPRLLISFHAVGSIVIGDPGGYSAGYANRYASLVGYRDATYNASNSFDYSISGAYEDWSYRNVAIPSIVVELSSYSSVSSGGHYKALWSMMD